MTDIGIIIAISGATITIVGIILAMIFWVRQESNALRLDAKTDRQDLVQMVYAMREETTKQINAIHLEMKDFHYKLLEIERNR